MEIQKIRCHFIFFLFCRERHRNVQRFIMHANSCCSTHHTVPFVSWHSYCSCHGLLELTNNMSVHWFLSRSKIWHITQQNVMSCHISSLLKVCLFEMASLIFFVFIQERELKRQQAVLLKQQVCDMLFFFWRYLIWWNEAQ